MFTHPRRLLAGGALAVAVAVAAVVMAVDSAASPDSPTGAVAAPSATTAGKSVVPSDLSALAASAGLTDVQLQAGLQAAKRAGGNGAAGIAAFAASTRVSSASAQRLVFAVFGAHRDGGLSSPDAVALLAGRLHITSSAAHAALVQLGRLSQAKGGVDPGSAAFTAVASGLGTSPQELAAALDGVKQGMAGK
ncbi:MAG TPA: hypothetical protein VGH11_19615 [Jatrophihabitans sp.]|jgi:hypothetical protein